MKDATAKARAYAQTSLGIRPVEYGAYLDGYAAGWAAAKADTSDACACQSLHCAICYPAVRDVKSKQPPDDYPGRIQNPMNIPSFPKTDAQQVPASDSAARLQKLTGQDAAHWNECALEFCERCEGVFLFRDVPRKSCDHNWNPLKSEPNLLFCDNCDATKTLTCEGGSKGE